MTQTAADHPIEIMPKPKHVRVIHRGITVADTFGALALLEAGHPEVLYLPRADVNMARLERSTHTTHCPYKGDASYFHLKTEDGIVENAVWTYEEPLAAVEAIRDYLSFYISRVDRIEETGPELADPAD